MSSDDTELVARLTSLVQTLLVALVVYAFGRRFFGWLAGTAAVLLFSVNPVVRFYGISGMRDPLFALTMLLFFLLLFSPDPTTRRPRQSAMAGLAAALMTLTRIHGYALFAGALFLQAIHERAWRQDRWWGFARVAANYARYAYQYLPFYLRGYEWLWIVLPAGIVAACFTRRGFVAGLLVLSLCHVVFLLNLNQIPGARGIENRFVYQASPLALLLVLYGLLYFARRLLIAGSRVSPTLARIHVRLAPLLPADSRLDASIRA